MTTADTQHTGLARAQVQASSPKELVHTTKRRAKTNKIKNLFMLLSPLQSPPPRRRHTGQTTDWLAGQQRLAKSYSCMHAKVYWESWASPNPLFDYIFMVFFLLLLLHTSFQPFDLSSEVVHYLSTQSVLHRAVLRPSSFIACKQCVVIFLYTNWFDSRIIIIISNSSSRASKRGGVPNTVPINNLPARFNILNISPQI